MSETVSQQVEQGDAELITAVRAGETDAYGALFERHRSAALRLARQLLPGTESEDLVSEAFTKVLVQLQHGRGPDLAFRAYLLTAIRRLHVDRIRSAARVRTTDDESELDRQVEFFDTAAANFERGTASDAFASLPERWQLVLWHLDVEGQKPADVAPLLGMSANSVSALAYRAREGLRQAYLQHHLADTASGDCRWATGRLGAHVRKGLSHRDAARVDGHLDECRRCMGIYLELTEVNSDLAGILAPAILGTAAAGYLAAGSASLAATAGAAFGFKALLSAGAKAVIEPVQAAVAGASVQGATAAVVVATVASTSVYAATGGLEKYDAADIKRSVAAAPAVPAPIVAPATEPTVEPAIEPTAEPITAPPIIELGPFIASPVVDATQELPALVVEPPELPALVVEPPELPAVVVEPPVPPEEPPVETPVETPADAPTDAPTDTPADTQADPLPPASVSTDLGIGAITITDDSLLQRRISIPVTSQTSGDAKNLTLKVTIEFDNYVQFRGLVGTEWECGDQPVDAPIRSITCTRPQSGPDVPPLVLAASGSIVESSIGADIAVAAADNADPNAANDTAHFEVDFLPSTS